MDYRKRKRRRHTFNVPGDAHELTFSCDHRFEFLNSHSVEDIRQAIKEPVGRKAIRHLIDNAPK